MIIEIRNRLVSALMLLIASPASAYGAGDCRSEEDIYARLACYECQAFVSGVPSACLKRDGDQQRLACFDNNGGITSRPDELSSARAEYFGGMRPAPEAFKDRLRSPRLGIRSADNHKSGPPEQKELFDVSIGVGVGVVPTYEGSSRHAISPMPFFKFVYDDMVSLDMGGLTAYGTFGKFRVGGGLTYNGGRQDGGGSGIFRQGDDHLKGLGSIDGALGIKGFASYEFRGFNFGGGVTKFTGRDNDGILVDVGISMPTILTSQLSIIPRLAATWADRSHMQTYFGVTSQQAANSRFSQFTAHPGIKNVEAGVAFNYQFNQHWFVGGNVGVKELLNDAAKSPITSIDTDASMMTMAGYHF